MSRELWSETWAIETESEDNDFSKQIEICQHANTDENTKLRICQYRYKYIVIVISCLVGWEDLWEVEAKTKNFGGNRWESLKLPHHNQQRWEKIGFDTFNEKKKIYNNNDNNNNDNNDNDKFGLKFKWSQK